MEIALKFRLAVLTTATIVTKLYNMFPSGYKAVRMVRPCIINSMFWVTFTKLKREGGKHYTKWLNNTTENPILGHVSTIPKMWLHIVYRQG